MKKHFGVNKMPRLKYLSVKTIESLRENIKPNLDRYSTLDFTDLMNEGEWSIELSLDVDLAPLSDLNPDGSPQAEILNSKLVWRALGALKPSVAYEEGIWVRLTHIECLDYTRARWIADKLDHSEMETTIATHFFARTLGMRRDDNAISRLWYNGYIANQMMPNDEDSALELLLTRADSRMTLLERSRTGSRSALASGVIRAAKLLPWVIENQYNFRDFMVVLNKNGGGKVFEAMPPHEIDRFMQNCAVRAGMPIAIS